MTCSGWQAGLGQKADQSKAFFELCHDFKISDAVFQLFILSPMDCLDDFRFYFNNEDQISSCVAQIVDLRDAALHIQVARVRRAWSSVRQSHSNAR